MCYVFTVPTTGLACIVQKTPWKRQLIIFFFSLNIRLSITIFGITTKDNGVLYFKYFTFISTANKFPFGPLATKQTCKQNKASTTWDKGYSSPAVHNSRWWSISDFLLTSIVSTLPINTFIETNSSQFAISTCTGAHLLQASTGSTLHFPAGGCRWPILSTTPHPSSFSNGHPLQPQTASAPDDVVIQPPFS